MVTWLTRSLLFIVAGAVLAYAVTVHNDTIDLQTTGVILLLVGIFDLLLNFGLSMYLRHPTPSADPYRWSVEDGRRIEPGGRRAASPGVRPVQRTDPRIDPDAPGDERYATRPIRRDHPDWH